MFQMLFLAENTSAAGRRDLLRYLKALDPTVFPDGGGQSDRGLSENRVYSQL